MSPEDTITPAQAAMIAGIGIVAGGIYLWPQPTIQAGGQTAGWAVLAAGPMMMAALALWNALLRPWRGSDLGTVLSAALGLLGRLLTWWYAVLLILYMAAVGSLFGTLSSEVLAPRTPAPIFIVFAAGVGAWAATLRLPTLGRLAQLWATIAGVLTIAIGAVGVRNLHWPSATLPVIPLHLAPVVNAMLREVYLWVPYPLLLTLVRRTNSPFRHVPRAVWISVWAQWALLIWLYALTVGTLGTWPVRELRWPTVFVYELIEVSSFLITQVGVLVVVVWTVVFITFWAANMWHIGVLLRGKARAADPRVVLAASALSVALGCVLQLFPAFTTQLLSADLSVAIALWTATSLGCLGVRVLVGRRASLGS